MRNPVFNRNCKWIVIYLGLVFVIGTMVISPLLRGGEEEESAQKILPSDMKVHVKTLTVQSGELPITLKSVGTITPRQQSPASVVPLLPGIVTSVEVQDGQKVEAGSVIVRLDARKTKNALNKTKAGLRLVESDLQKAIHGGLDAEQVDLELAAKQAEVTAQQARLEADRQKALLEEHLTSEKAEFDAKKAMEEADRRAKAAKEKADNFRTVGRSMELAHLQAAFDQAQAELAAAELDSQAIEIRAPQSGRISGLKAGVGNMVDDKTVIAQVIGDRTAVLRFWLSPPDADQIEMNAAISIPAASPEIPLTGRIISIGGELDPETGLIPVEAQLESNLSKSFRMGETVLAEVTTHSPVKGIVVPESSIVVEDDKAGLFVVDEKQIAHAVPVQVLARTAEQAVVQSEGLEAGAKVIVDGNYNLPDGAHVVEELSK